MRCASLLIGSTLIFTQALYAAEEEEPITSLDTIIVVATQSPQKAFGYPGMATVIESSNPATAGSMKIKDLLLDSNSVEFSGSARRSGQDISIRGYGTNGLVILFDGVRQKFEGEHDGKFFIDPALLKKVEIIRGSSSALYGSGGLGGVVSFETKSAADLLAPGKMHGGLTSIGFNSVNDESLISQTGFARGKNFDLLASINLRQSDDIKLGDGNKLPSEDDIVSGLFKFALSPSPSSTLKLNLQHYQNNAEEPNNPQAGLDSTDELALLQQDKETVSNRVSLEFQYQNPANNKVNLNARVYHNSTEVEEQGLGSTRPGAMIRSLSRALDSTGINIVNQSIFQSKGGFRQTWAYGLEYYTEDQKGQDTGAMNGESGGIPDAESSYWGIFLQDEIELAGKLGKLLIIPGVRVDNYESKNKTGLSLDEQEVSPKLGVAYKPKGWLLVFANYAKAFRAPNMTEIFTTGIHFPQDLSARPPTFNRFVPNPNLKPEKNESFEFGFGVQFDDLIQTNDRLQIKLARFQVESEDYISLTVNIPGLTTNSSNIPKAELDGYEFEGSYENSLIKFTLGYSEMEGINPNGAINAMNPSRSNRYLFEASPDTLKTGIEIKLPVWGSIIGWRATFAADHDKVNNPADEARDSYNAHNVYYQWHPEGSSNITINLGIDNLFDENYSRAFADSPEPARNYRIQLSLQW